MVAGGLCGNRATYSLIKAAAYWSAQVNGQSVLFSFDAGTRDGLYAPHSPDGTSTNCPGMNILRTDGSGLWINQNQTALVQWHSGAGWMRQPSGYIFNNGPYTLSPPQFQTSVGYYGLGLISADISCSGP